MNCYAKLTGAILAIVASTNGVSNEVNILLLEDQIRQRVLNYGEDRNIIVIGWDEKNNRVNKDSVIPFEKKDFEISLKEYYVKHAHSLWIESTHYLENSNRVDHLLQYEINTLDYLPKNFEKFIKILEI